MIPDSVFHVLSWMPRISPPTTQEQSLGSEQNIWQSGSSKFVGHMGTRGTAFSNIASLKEYYNIEEVWVNSKRLETRVQLVREIRNKLSINAVPVDDAESAVRGADIFNEVTRLENPEILIRDEWVKENYLLITYGWVMATDPRTIKRASKVVVDDWEQCCKGGQLHPLLEDGRLRREDVHGEIGEIATQLLPGREVHDGVIVFWHRGFAISDIMLGSQILDIVEKEDIGTAVTLFDQADE